MALTAMMMVMVMLMRGWREQAGLAKTRHGVLCCCAGHGRDEVAHQAMDSGEIVGEGAHQSQSFHQETQFLVRCSPQHRCPLGFCLCGHL